MQVWHLTLAATRRAVLFPEEATRRLAVRALAKAAGDSLVLFSIVDDHVHVVVMAEESRVGILARSLLLTLTPLSSSKIEAAHRRAVEGRKHLEWLVSYCLLQPSKHGIDVHPALWSGSCFADMIGARIIGDMRLRLGDVLPRFGAATVIERVDLPPASITPIPDDRLRRLGAHRITAAATAALAADPELRGRALQTVLARTAAAQLAKAAGLPATEIAWSLGLTRQATSRLFKRSLDGSMMRAVRIRLSIEEAVAATGNHRPDAPARLRDLDAAAYRTGA